VTTTVAAVIPHFADVARIGRQLAAIAGQTRPFSEIVIVDDASAPEDYRELERLVAPLGAARLIRRFENGGPVQATMDGLASVSSRYCAMLASDDEVKPHFVERAAGALDATEGAAFAFSDPTFADDAGAVRNYPLFLAPETRALSPGDFAVLLRRNYFTFATNAILYRTAALREIGGLPPELSSFADSFVNFVLAFRHGAVYLPESLALIHASKGSFSSRELDNAAAVRDITLRMINLLDDRFGDVREAFRRTAVLPAHSAALLGALLASPAGRRYLTPSLALKCLAIASWHAVSGRVPPGLRRFVRRAASRVARS
jgi:glycosyltransferase involved in cell wall biosynthesis